ncbi:unnamed protein product [Rotaria sordida]|uniref:Cytochrome P450 n=1 Tax=Rotaria sordida TaxID=392033 RepID=A0A815D381_9BILA|nr:unnamed protein product [Rotaria sordida]CAF4064869.1 unnamed protein product [Rotaria sordida]
MFVILTLVFVSLLVLYVKYKHFTSRRSIPSIPGHFLFGNLLQSGLLRGTSILQVYTSFKNQLGDIYEINLGFLHAIVVGDIDDVQHIFSHRHIYDQSDWVVELLGVLIPDGLITLKGTKFKRHASITTPLFRHGKIISNFDLIIDCTDELLNNWRSSSSDHIHCDILQQCQNLVMEIFGFIGFDYDFGTLRGTDNNELAQALKNYIGTWEFGSYLPSFLFGAYLKLSPKCRRTHTTIKRHLYRMIEQELIETPESRAQRKKTSLIASLVASLQTDEQAEERKSEEEKKGLTRREILGEMLMFLIAGFETTSTALAWSIHLLSKHSEVQHKIKAELLKENVHHDLILDRLDSLIYLDCVIKEILRFSSPVETVSRTLTMDDRLPKSGIQLYKGDQIFIPVCILSRDPRYWSIDPELFYPERFLGEDKNHNAYAFLLFGSGRRQCIGQDLARFELKVIVAGLMQHVTFIDGGPEVNAGGRASGLTAMPKYVGVKIKFDSEI